MSAVMKRRGDHGASAWSGATRRRLLAMLLEKATSGDVLAAEAILRLQAHYGGWAPVAAIKTNVAEAPL
jgi:hypothetical protein